MPPRTKLGEKLKTKLFHERPRIPPTKWRASRMRAINDGTLLAEQWEKRHQQLQSRRRRFYTGHCRRRRRRATTPPPPPSSSSSSSSSETSGSPPAKDGYDTASSSPSPAFPPARPPSGCAGGNSHWPDGSAITSPVTDEGRGEFLSLPTIPHHENQAPPPYRPQPPPFQEKMPAAYKNPPPSSPRRRALYSANATISFKPNNDPLLPSLAEPSDWAQFLKPSLPPEPPSNFTLIPPSPPQPQLPFLDYNYNGQSPMVVGFSGNTNPSPLPPPSIPPPTFELLPPRLHSPAAPLAFPSGLMDPFTSDSLLLCPCLHHFYHHAPVPVIFRNWLDGRTVEPVWDI